MRSMSSAVRRLLLVAAVVILALYVITAAITRPVNGDTQTYKADFTDAFGLHKNADVRIRGVQVGKVVDISLQRSGVARVEFTVLNGEKLTDTDQLAIRFQNLVGQRYLSITKGGRNTAAGAAQGTTATGAGGAAGAPLDPGKVIPASETTGSFDITALFNGMRPILTGADPAVFNQFATHMLDLIQGEHGVGIGDVLTDVEKLTNFATDKRALIRVIVNNLGVISESLQGRSEMITSLMKNMEMLFDTLEVNLELLKGAFGEGARVFPPTAEILTHTLDLTLGGHDDVSTRLMDVIPDPKNLANTLEVVPTLLTTLNTSMDQLGLDRNCSRGKVELPALGDVLLAGGRLTLCKA
ncbi:MCE family protein [Gordonia amarae]|nr:MCE family protein [Gordonia amarae]QHN20929.1 MCE family protein [Gordonia amarae]QHN29780.1 MCE family protein [Gordonia amarae]QHN38555.1 MCE family protein [Gordonia amarae]